MAKNSNKKNSGLLVAIVCVVVIILVMLFFMKKDNIVQNLKKTNFFERVGVSTPEFVLKHPENSQNTEEEIEIDVTGRTSDDVKKSENSTELKNESENSELEQKSNSNDEKSVETKIGDTEKKVIEEKKEVQPKVAKKTETEKKVVTTRKANLCFISIDSDGSVNRKMVQRSMPKTDSPLTENIKALLEGPSLDEKKANCMTLIPEETRLIGASVKNGIATLNFSENFEFNTYGVEGCIGQLMQIVYTATEFSTVKSVQFLIEGEKKDYLGTEGQWIGSPLSRSNFN